jgi:hypothetical protein
MANFKITAKDLTADHLVNSRGAGGLGFLFRGTDFNDTAIIDVTQSAIEKAGGLWVGFVGGGGADSMTTVPRMDADAPFALFYADDREMPFRFVGHDRLDLTAGNFGFSGPGRDKYFLHPGDYMHAGPATLFADIRTDDIFLADDDNRPRVVDFDFTMIENRNGVRMGHLESVTIEGHTRNMLTDGMTAKVMVGVEREGPRPDHVVSWEVGSHGAKAAVMDFVMDGVGEWLFL